VVIISYSLAVATTPPVIAGSAQEGAALSLTPGVWDGQAVITGKWQYSPDNDLTQWEDAPTPLPPTIPYETTGWYVRYLEQASVDGNVVAEAASNILGPITVGPPPKWIPLNKASGLPVDVATGGVITKSATHVTHTFAAATDFGAITPVGTFSTTRTLQCEVLVLASGGAGQTNAGGGGGAGGMLEQALEIPAGDHPIIVGRGGWPNDKGEDSSIGTLLTAKGGGRGRAKGETAPAALYDGGSGGGGSTNGPGASFGSGIPGQGYDGGPQVDAAVTYGGGGGGGAGGPGGAGATADGGTGGVGRMSSLLGIILAGGGGGGCESGSASAGGTGGGGTGGGQGEVGGDGAPGTGSGGGGAGYQGATSGKGGSGIVVIRYPIQTDAISAPADPHWVPFENVTTPPISPLWVPVSGPYPTLAVVRAPAVEGACKPGSSLTRVPGVWGRASVVTWAWLVNGAERQQGGDTFPVPNEIGSLVTLVETAVGAGRTLTSSSVASQIIPNLVGTWRASRPWADVNSYDIDNMQPLPFFTGNPAGTGVLERDDWGVGATDTPRAPQAGTYRVQAHVEFPDNWNQGSSGDAGSTAEVRAGSQAQGRGSGGAGYSPTWDVTFTNVQAGDIIQVYWQGGATGKAPRPNNFYLEITQTA
jgi:hypothetical protein